MKGQTFQHGIQEVVGSIPISSTKPANDLRPPMRWPQRFCPASPGKSVQVAS
jgi:hypothetical protein